MPSLYRDGFFACWELALRIIRRRTGIFCKNPHLGRHGEWYGEKVRSQKLHSPQKFGATVTETGCQGTARLQALGILTLEPERLKNRPATARKDHRRWKGLFRETPQAACDLNFSASKSSPFFQRVSVMAAILRASVRRAMVGLMRFSRPHDADHRSAHQRIHTQRDRHVREWT